MNAWGLLGLWVLAAQAGNGSIGVGSARVPVSSCLSVRVPDASVRMEAGVLKEAVTGRPILKVSRVEGAAAAAFLRASVPARLGTAAGRETLPALGEKGLNSWAVCSPDGRACERLEPLVSDSALIPMAIGTLKDDCKR